MWRCVLLLSHTAAAVAALISLPGIRLARALLTEDLEIRRTSRGERAKSGLLALALPRRLRSPAIAGNSPTLILAVRLIGRVHLLVILVEVDGTLVIRGDVVSALLGLVMLGLAVSAASVRRLVLHVIQPLVPVAVASVALLQRSLNCLAPRVGSSILALLEPVLQLAGAVMETQINLPAHLLSLVGGETRCLMRGRDESSNTD